MIREWCKQENQLITLEKNKHSFRTQAAKWLQLETEVKNWVRDHRNNGTSVSTKMIICEARRWAAARDITDFAGTPCLGFPCAYALAPGLRKRCRPSMNLKLLIFTDVINARKKTLFELGQIGNMKFL
jgi:hypothetical protein